MYKKIVLLAFLAVAMASCGTRKAAVSSSKKLTGTQQDVIDYGMKFLNKPYRYAAKGPNAFDCSGFTSFVFKEFGINLSSSSAGQDKQVASIRRKEDLQVGDLVFFEGRRHNGKVGHVGIVKEISPNGEFRFLHASTSNGVIVSRSTEQYYASRYLRGGRVLTGNNLLIASQKTPKKKAEPAKTPDKRRNAFVPAKAKEQVLVQAPKTQTEKEIEVSHAQNPHIPELQEAKNDTIIIHTRPILPDSTSSQNKEDNDTISQLVARVITPRDSIVIPKPVEIKITANAPITHEVKPGETLYSISRQYNCTVEQLREWNPEMGSVLKSGEKLVVGHEE